MAKKQLEDSQIPKPSCASVNPHEFEKLGRKAVNVPKSEIDELRNDKS